MNEFYSSKRYVVSGAGSGIGRACAERLLSLGASVLGLDLSPSVVETFAGDAYTGVVTDVTDEDAIRDAVSGFVEGGASIDGVVSNAGVFVSGTPIVETDVAKWQMSLAVNLTSHFLLLQATIPHLTDGIASVIIVGSRNVPAPGAGAAPYSCAKAGATQLARVAALELGPRGIRVNTVHPDAVFDTAVWTPEVLESSARRYGMSVEEYKSQNVLKTEIGQADVAEGICTILGPALSKTTGAQIPIDGGNTRVI